MCRQRLAEFCEADLVVGCDEDDDESGEPIVAEYTLGEWLPAAMSQEYLK